MRIDQGSKLHDMTDDKTVQISQRLYLECPLLFPTIECELVLQGQFQSVVEKGIS